MVVGVVVYEFKLDIDDENEIEPEFKVLHHELTEDSKDLNIYEIISINDLFSIFYNHTAGSRGALDAGRKGSSSNFFIGRLKESQYAVISYFRESLDDRHFMTMGVFGPNDDVDRYEDTISLLAGKMDVTFDKMSKGNLRSASFVKSIEDEIKENIRFALFQMDRLTNLTKTQKVGLIYVGPERSATIELLRQGPISRHALLYYLTEIKENTNIDQVLRPFTELNIIRRDWIKGEKDKRSKIVFGQGEYVFLVKDVILIRKPPKTLIEVMKKNEDIGPKYLERLNEFYLNYKPYENCQDESKLLGSFVLNSDVYDLMALLGNRMYAKEKMPKVVSEFSDVESIIEQLEEAKLITIIKDKMGREMVCLLGEIIPVVVFPEYMVNNIQNRLLKKGESLVNIPEKDPLTVGVARRALELLESSYSEKIKFE
ncbi:MAG: hypothetical protein GF364_12280 [Candidatus Lokiarchaeota archaeon]|nr:hypothetical protein [Candidatus Lokiarchaeota archaeon]